MTLFHNIYEFISNLFYETKYVYHFVLAIVTKLKVTSYTSERERESTVC